MPMVRMSGNRLTKLRMYGSKLAMSRNTHAANAVCVGWSKIRCYETPYSVTDTIKRTGLKQTPKGICTDKLVGTWKAMNTNVKRVATQ